MFWTINRTAGLTLFVGDPGCDETYEEAQRDDTKRKQQLPLSLGGVGPAHGTSATEESHLRVHTNTQTQEKVKQCIFTIAELVLCKKKSL